MRDYWLQLEELDIKLLPGRDGNGRPACPRGSPMLAGFMWTHTLSTRIEYDPVVSKWPPDLYPSRFKGPVVSAEIEVLTAALDSFSLIPLLMSVSWRRRMLAPRTGTTLLSLMSLSLPVWAAVRLQQFANKQMTRLLLFRPRVP